MLLSYSELVRCYRYEPHIYWYHILIVGYKLGFVILKIFFFQSFWQGPIAMILVYMFVLTEAYATPFGSKDLDQLTTLVQSTLFCEIMIGMLFCTEHGQGMMQDALIYVFYLAFLITLVSIAYIACRDTACYHKVGMLPAVIPLNSSS